MSKKKRLPETSVTTTFKVDTPDTEPPCDTLTVKVLCLRLHDDPPVHFAIKVTFSDQLILSSVIKSIGCKDAEQTKVLAKGTMDYDPSDYEKMCMFADCPLVVHIQPLKNIDLLRTSQTQTSDSSTNTRSSLMKPASDISCCNIDILPIFLSNEDNQKLTIRKRMEPLKTPSALQCKSWDCLPLLTMEARVSRHKDNAMHHKILKEANWLKLTLVGSYNMIIPFDSEYIYTAASKTLLNQEFNTALATFNEGHRVPRRFNHSSFYPKWESLRVGENLFTKGDEKFSCKLEDIQNEDNIDLNYYVNGAQINNVVWGSFHRSLLLKKSSENWLIKHIQKFKWPLEVHIYGDSDGYSFMAFINLFSLLYPGEDTIRVAVPLQWINATTMLENCDCQLLLTPNEKAFSSFGAVQKPSRMVPSDYTPSGSTVTWPPPNTGGDGNDAFAIIEVKLKRPLKKRAIPPQISPENLQEMLKDLEKAGVDKRSCTGRGQLVSDWKSILQTSAASLRRVPYYGVTDFCAFNRQLSETRSRVELITSCWQGAAVYVNNNFVVQQYLYPDDGKDIYDEMLMMVHACLMRIATDSLLGTKDEKETSPVYKMLKAARHARQMQDVLHAMELYFQVIVNRPNDGNCWREASTCLKEIDLDWANVCLNKAIVVDPRHPLTLISKGGTLFEKDPASAEMFLYAVIAYYPFWTTAWVIASAYYFYRGHFLLAEKILNIVQENRRLGIAEELGYPRAWERELGDWWDSTPYLPGTSYFCDAADLLLRLRCVGLAEVCVSRMLTNAGESAAYYHLVALCCRLRGEYKDAICHLRTAEIKYGTVGYLKSLEAECHHKLHDIAASMECYEKTGQPGTPYNTILSLPMHTEPNRPRTVIVDLVRRQPSAYAWLALADNWLTKADAEKQKDDVNMADGQATITRCAAAFVVQALRYDRSAAKAWALLATLTRPSARRHHCLKMAALCGFKINEDCLASDTQSQQSSCYQLGVAITECRCAQCKRLRL